MQKNLSRIGNGLLLYGICGFGFQILYTIFLPCFLEKSVINEVWFSWGSVIIPVYMASFPIFLLYMRDSISVPVIKRKMSFKELLMCVLIGAALCGIGMIAGSGIDYFLFHNNGTELDSLFFSSDLCWRVLCAGIIAPVVEEIIFRRYLVSTIAPYSERAAVIVSGILFALQHGNFSQFFYTLLLGMFWGYIFLRTGNVIYTIILHMIFNLTTVLFTVTIYQLFREIYLIWCVILVAFGIIGGIIAIAQRKKIFFAQMSDKTVFRQLFSSNGMVLYISYCIGIFWVNYAVEW